MRKQPDKNSSFTPCADIKICGILISIYYLCACVRSRAGSRQEICPAADGKTEKIGEFLHDGRIAAFHCQDISQCHIWFFHLGILFPFDIKYFISRRHLYPSFLLPVAPARSAFLHLPGLSPGHHYNSRSFRSEQLSAGHKEHSPRYIFFFFPIASASFVICFR